MQYLVYLRIVINFEGEPHYIITIYKRKGFHYIHIVFI